MKHLLAVTIGAILAACSSCATPGPAPVPPPPPEPDPVVIGDAAPSPDDDDASRLPSASAICAHLHTLGCDDAASLPACTSVLEHAITTRITNVPRACLVSAPSKTAARACGLVSCN